MAPDHPEVKSVTADFEAVASDPRTRFLGNVAIGRDISVADLSRHYNAVVLAYGAASDRYLGVPGETLRNVCSARAFVNWYNGHPEFKSAQFDLDVEDVVIVGQGNVAIDCARILSKTIAELQETDIAQHALAALSKSRVKRVHVLGRRGHVQAAFTMKELREVTKLTDAALIVRESELAKGRTPASLVEIETHRAKKRMDSLLGDVVAASRGAPKDKARELHLRFFLSPTAILPSASDSTKVGAVECEVTELQGEPDEQSAAATGRKETITAGLVLRSIGYKSLSVPGVPFDAKRAVVRNVAGRVVEEDGRQVCGVYVSGWLKRGPSGIIGTNIPDARETVGCILEDKAAGKLSALQPGIQHGIEGVTAALVASGKDTSHLVTWEGYRRIDAAEKARGSATGKPREKLTDIAEMIHCARNHEIPGTSN